MIKRKLTSAKNFIADHKYEIGATAGTLTLIGFLAVAYPEALEAVEDTSKEVIETATHTIILIEK